MYQSTAPALTAGTRDLPKLSTETLEARLVDSVTSLYASLEAQDVPWEDRAACVNQLSNPLSAGDPQRLYARTAEWLARDGWKVYRAPFVDETRGETRGWESRVQIADSLDDASAAAVLIHEAAHITLGHIYEDYSGYREMFEVEAESTSYIVAGLHGLDTSSLAVGYVAGWGQGQEDFVRTVVLASSRIASGVERITDAIDGIRP